MPTPLLRLQQITPSDINKATEFNLNARFYEVLFSGVASRTVTAPPTNPQDGDSYVVPTSGATGDWLGCGDCIAVWIDGEASLTDEANRWYIAKPSRRLQGLILEVQDSTDISTRYIRWDGTAWANANLEGAAAGGSSNLAIGAVTGAEVPITNDNGTGVTIPAATATTAGAYPAADFAKLAAIETGATGDQNADEVSFYSSRKYFCHKCPGCVS